MRRRPLVEIERDINLGRSDRVTWEEARRYAAFVGAFSGAIMPDGSDLGPLWDTLGPCQQAELRAIADRAEMFARFPESSDPRVEGARLYAAQRKALRLTFLL